MTSFLEKLKKGMGIEDQIEEETKEKEIVVEKEKKEEPKKKKIVIKEKEEKPKTKKEEWLEAEGQLMIDLYQTEDDLFLQAPIAGVEPEDLEIEFERDTLTIKGERKNPAPEDADFITKECYWGKFSRQIILPVEIDPNKIEASFQKGILIIKLPKLLKEKKRKIVLK